MAFLSLSLSLCFSLSQKKTVNSLKCTISWEKILSFWVVSVFPSTCNFLTSCFIGNGMEIQFSKSNFLYFSCVSLVEFMILGLVRFNVAFCEPEILI